MSVILLFIYHFCKTDPQILTKASPPSEGPSSGTGNAVHSGRDVNGGKDTVPVHHRLLQFNANVLADSNAVTTGREMDLEGRVNAEQDDAYRGEEENGGETGEFLVNVEQDDVNRGELYKDSERRALLVNAEQEGAYYREEADKDGADDERDEDGLKTDRDISSYDTNSNYVSLTAENSRNRIGSLEATNAPINHSDVDTEQAENDVNIQRSDMPEYHKHIIGNEHPLTQGHCDASDIKSWSRGVVTDLHPRISANCDLLKSNNRQEIERVKKEIKSWQSSQSEEEWRQGLLDCDKVVAEFTNNFYNSPEEIDFPLAYILVVYTNPQQMVRLIKALWRPQNLFCIHPDAKQSKEFIDVFRQLSKCLHNVFLPAKLEKVYYQHHTIMDSQMNCYQDLLTYPFSRWKYVINLCGRELPLKTNREMVRSLKTLRGASAVETKHVQTKGFLTKDRFTWKAAEDYESGKLHYTNSRLGTPPIPIYKSFNFIAVSRPFVNFIINDHKAIEFRNYLKDVKIPEEEFYASLVHLPGVPGGLPPHRVPLPTVDKYIWMNKNHQTRSYHETCEGRMVHFICIVGVGDLDQIYRWGVQRKPAVFFFNKYFMEDDHVVMDCMEERLLQQNRREYEMDCLHKH